MKGMIINMIEGYIMTGGKNSRMNGKKKIFLEYNNKSFLDNILGSFKTMFEKVYLSVEAPEPYEHLKMPLVVDEIKEIGPMGGIYSGLKKCDEDALFIVACDMPFVSETAIKRIIECYLINKNKVILAYANGREQPLLGIYPKIILPTLEKQVKTQNYRLMDLLDETGYSVVNLPANDPSSININTPEEYKLLK